MNNTTTSAIIKKIERTLKKATPGKWCAFIAKNTYAVHTPGDNRCGDIINWQGFDDRKNAASNAAYIAAVNPANIAALLAYVRELEARAGESNNAQPLNTAKLINKFYERYPLETFSSDSVRAEALGYFMAGAELQCHGDFINYEGCCHDE